ncbi:hypothetical protein MnBA_06910 [Marinobacterium sp. BA1]
MSKQLAQLTDQGTRKGITEQATKIVGQLKAKDSLTATHGQTAGDSAAHSDTVSAAGEAEQQGGSKKGGFRHAQRVS